MTLNLAAKRTSIKSPLARALARRAHVTAANDNALMGSDLPPCDQAKFDEALRFFGKHGLGAAGEARKLAEQAFNAGDRRNYNRWLGICRILDRRLAFDAANAIEAR